MGIVFKTFWDRTIFYVEEMSLRKKPNDWPTTWIVHREMKKMMVYLQNEHFFRTHFRKKTVVCFYKINDILETKTFEKSTFFLKVRFHWTNDYTEWRVRPIIRFLDPPSINFVHDHLFFSKFIIIHFFII